MPRSPLSASPRALLLLLCLPIPAAFGAPTPERLDELHALLQSGNCDALYRELEPLRSSSPRDPDLIALEANCRLIGSRTITQTFDSAAYERLSTGSGLPSLPAATMQGLNRITLHHEAKGLDRALALFDEAAKVAPEREDMLAGAIAARIANGLTRPAIERITQRKRELSTAVLGDLASAVQDALAVGQRQTAEAVAATLTELFPADPSAHGAAALCAAARRDYPAERRALSRMASLVPSDPSLAIRTATAALWVGEYDEVIALTVPHAALQPEARVLLALARSRGSLAAAAPIWSELGAALGKLEAPPAAMRATVDHYLRISGSSAPPTALMRLRGGRQLAAAGLSLPALVEFDAAAALDPTMIEAQRASADLLRAALRFDAALAVLDRAIESLARLPAGQSAYTPAELQRDRCAVLYGLGRDTEARTACESARAGGHPDAIAEALVALAQNRRDAALELLKAGAAEGGESGARAKAKYDALTSAR